MSAEDQINEEILDIIEGSVGSLQQTHLVFAIWWRCAFGGVWVTRQQLRHRWPEELNKRTIQRWISALVNQELAITRGHNEKREYKLMV